MTFRTADLSVLAYANGFTLWHYRTEDGVHEVFSAGYFDPAHAMLKTGDMMLTNYSNAGVPTGTMLLVTEAFEAGQHVAVRSLCT